MAGNTSFEGSAGIASIPNVFRSVSSVLCEKTDEGPVIYDPDICIGCRYCMIACPWEIPRYSWEDTVPYIQKCDMCYERVVHEGAIPACVEACPEKATIFGERDELLAEARRRLAVPSPTSTSRRYGERRKSAVRRSCTSRMWRST